jgi:hypothetical protein
MAFDDSYSKPDIGGVNAARHRAEAEAWHRANGTAHLQAHAQVAARLSLITKCMMSATRNYTVSDKFFHFSQNGARYAVAKALVER